MTKRRLISAVCLAALLCTTACRHGVNTIENAQKAHPPQAITDMRLITDARLDRRIVLKQVNTARNAAGFLTVQLDAINMHLGKLPLRLKYKFDWFDAQGMRIDTAISTWQEIVVRPGEDFVIPGVAPRPACADFKVSLTLAR